MSNMQTWLKKLIGFTHVHTLWHKWRTFGHKRQQKIEALQAAQAAMKRGLFSSSVTSVGAATKIYMMAGMMGFDPPEAVLGGMSVIKDKIVLEANLMVAAAYKSNKCKYFVPVVVNQEKAVYKTMRTEEGAVEATREYTVEDAKMASLLDKNIWKLHRAAMLASRCKAALVRDVYPDVLMGCYTPDELE